MFSVRQKREISARIQVMLRNINHPELSKTEEIRFALHVVGATPMSWADIQNNGAIVNPTVNPHNEAQDPSYDDKKWMGIFNKKVGGLETNVVDARTIISGCIEGMELGIINSELFDKMKLFLLETGYDETDKL